MADFKNIAKKALQWLLPFALTILLVWYMFRKVDFAEMLRILREGVSYGWILLAMGISILSHMARAARWRLQLSAVGIRPPFMALCCSIFGCYALNLLFPRLGEVWRCQYIASRQKAPFTTVFGSMVADRLSDTLSVLLLLLLALALANSAILSFMDKYSIGRGIVALLSNPRLWLGGFAALAIILAAMYIWRDTRPVARIRKWLAELWQGFAAVASMPGRGKFLLLTASIWGCYFLQLYVAFFAFPFTAELCKSPELGFGLIPCLVAFVMSSIGMAIPSNGGLGPWNIAVMFGLAIYGINDAQGTAFSMLVWSAQTVMLILLGLFTIAYVLRKRTS